ncbi:hypothetical protein FG152_24500 [Ochrobactrum sp. XJ1]|nr:hypothetical protein [Ochrobactrum sp. XJ1]
MPAQDLLEKVATSIEQCGWEDVDVIQMNEVMALAAISTIYAALIDHARQEFRYDVIDWIVDSPIGIQSGRKPDNSNNGEK